MKWSWFELLVAVLKEVRMPATVIETLHKLGKNELDRIRVEKDTAALMALPGIAEKRSAIILRQLDKMSHAVRHTRKATTRNESIGFSVRTFEKEAVWAPYMKDILALRAYRYDKNDPNARARAVERLNELKEKLFAPQPLVIYQKEGRITRLSRFMLADVFGVDYEAKRPVTQFVVIEHGVQELFQFDWHLFGNEALEALANRDKFQQDIMDKFGYYGAKIVNNVGSYLYGGIAASASHQKKEKILMGERETMRAHSKFLWFGKTLSEYYRNKNTGASYWKERANEIRPMMKPFVTKTGDYITAKDILFVKDVKKLYHILIARVFGEGKGACYTDREADEEVILGDGALLLLVEMAFNGQATLPGLKAMAVDATSSVEEVCRKHGIKLEDFMNLEVEGLDGEMHRIGDYKAVCGEGCWKFDKEFANFQDYMNWLEDMAKAYPGIDRLYLLRQSEEIEGEEKYRYFTRTLLQQFMYITDEEKKQLTAKAITGLQRDKTFSGAVRKMAGMWKTEEEKSPVEKIFEAYPTLVLNRNIQEYLKGSWIRRQVRALSGKFRTEGQYPYIMQDPVALLEVWLLGLDPNDPDLGVLKGDEMSIAEVPDGKEVVGVRFPANFQTAKVMTNRVHEAFESCGEVAIISIHSDVLIRQDGDVDGDEMCILYSKLVINIVKRMNATFKPPVVLFKHGTKADPVVFTDYKTFIHETYSALWRAKRYDQVGIYANLATACAYLASIAYVESGFNADDKNVKLRLLQMSAASTGAILAIDQVKGNDTDPALIKWLEAIRKDVAKAFSDIIRPTFMADIPDAAQGEARKELEKEANLKARTVRYPFVHRYVTMAKNNAVSAESCLPADERNICDSTTLYIYEQTGEYVFDYEGLFFDVDECYRLFTDARMRKIWKTVYTAPVSRESLALLNDNKFNRSNEADRPVIDKMNRGEKVGQKDLLVMMYHNKNAMAYHMEGENLEAKEREYYADCRAILFSQADNTPYICKRAENGVEAGYELTKEEKRAVVVNAAIVDALELGAKGNGIPDSNVGGYAMFVLNVFAPDILANIQKNLETEKVCDLGFSMDDLALECTIDLLSDEDDLYEATPVTATTDDMPPIDILENDEFICVYGDVEDEFLESLV